VRKVANGRLAPRIFNDPNLSALLNDSTGVTVQEEQSGINIRKNFSISDIPCAKGVYPILDRHTGLQTQFTPASIYVITVNYDEPSGGYTADTTRKQDNYIEVLNYNPADSTLEGRFQVFLIRDTLQSTPKIPVPDRINITGGKFYVKLLH
jgi:hypothetical protein